MCISIWGNWRIIPMIGRGVSVLDALNFSRLLVLLSSSSICYDVRRVVESGTYLIGAISLLKNYREKK